MDRDWRDYTQSWVTEESFELYDLKRVPDYIEPEEVPDPPLDIDHPIGAPLSYSTGELSFDTSPRTAGTFRGTYLGMYLDIHRSGHMSWYIRFLNKNGRIQTTPAPLCSGFNL